MGALLALASALFYGLADFAGGLLSRRAGFTAVALVGQLGGLVLALAVAPLVPVPGGVAAPDLVWGALSGVGTGVGMLFLYRGLSRGAMSVVVPVSAVGGVALPVLVGVVLLGDRPSPLSWLGIAATVPALWYVSRTRSGPGGGDGGGGTPSGGGSPVLSGASTDGLVASLGIALQYVALAQAGAGSGIWPVVAGRVAASLTILPTAVREPQGLRLPLRLAGAAAGTGGAAALALVCYLLATRAQISRRRGRAVLPLPGDSRPPRRHRPAGTAPAAAGGRADRGRSRDRAPHSRLRAGC